MLFLLLSTVYASAIYGAYDWDMLVPMSKYPLNYRSLSVWECFDAKGKFCHQKDYESMMNVTGSSNWAHGICCKMDYYGTYCNNLGEENYICSAPAEDLKPDSKYTKIQSQGNLNY